jgi:hypothetical protein
VPHLPTSPRQSPRHHPHLTVCLRLALVCKHEHERTLRSGSGVHASVAFFTLFPSVRARPTRSTPHHPSPSLSPSDKDTTSTRHRHDIDTTSTCSLSPPLPLPSPPSSATTPGQQCARSYDHATTTIMRPTMTPTTTRNDTMHSIARVVPSLVSWSCLKGLTSRRPVESAQTQTVLSSDPVAIFIASGETSTARTQLR